MKSVVAQVERFLEMFPGGFADPLYVFQERGQPQTQSVGLAYKDAAIDAAKEAFSKEALDRVIAGGGSGFFESAKHVVRATKNLLFSVEAARLGAQWKEPDRELAMAEGLRGLLYGEGPLAAKFDVYAATLRPDCASSWAVVTLLPAVACPNDFVFVKPTYMKKQAEILGTPITKAGPPTGEGYEQFLAVAKLLVRKVADLGVRRGQSDDLFDAYSFAFRTLVKTGYHGRTAPAILRTYDAPSTTGLLLLPGNDVIDLSGGGDQPWQLLTPTGERRGLPVRAVGGAVVPHGVGAELLAAEWTEPGTWWQWPSLRRIGPGPRVKLDDRRLPLLASTRDGTVVAWMETEGPSEHERTLVVRRQTRADERDIRIPIKTTDGPQHLVLNSAGTLAVLVHAGAGIWWSDIAKRQAFDVKLPLDGGHPKWGALHPSLAKAAVFNRAVHVVDLSKTAPDVWWCQLGGQELRAGEYTHDGSWLLFADTQRVYGIETGKRDVRAIVTVTTGGDPLRISFEGDAALVSRDGHVVAYDLKSLVGALSTAPVIRRLERMRVAADATNSELAG